MFKKYSSIENTYREAFVDKIIDCGCDKKCDWLVLEKVHGANFSFICHPKEGCDIDKNSKEYEDLIVEHAKRTAILRSFGFFDYKSVSDVLDSRIKKAYICLQKSYPNMKCMNIYGELYGGGYPGYESDHKLIQKGIYYNHSCSFVSFDVFVTFDDEKETDDDEKETRSTGKWLPYDEYSKILDECNIPHLKPLFRGSFQDALKFNKKFITTIPSSFHNLPDIEDNYAEGVVIKPSVNLHLPNNSRVILKNKIDKFSEIQKHNPTKKERMKKTLAKPQPNESENVSKVRDYITTQRLNNVISKIGPFGKHDSCKPIYKDFGKLMGSFSADILEEYYKDYQISDKERKLVGKIINADAGKLIFEYLKDN